MVASSFPLLKSHAATSPLEVVLEEGGEYPLEANTLEGFDDVTYTLLLEQASAE